MTVPGFRARMTAAEILAEIDLCFQKKHALPSRRWKLRRLWSAHIEDLCEELFYNHRAEYEALMKAWIKRVFS